MFGAQDASGSRSIEGCIDDVRYYDGVLSAQYIALVYAGEEVGITIPGYLTTITPSGTNILVGATEVIPEATYTLHASPDLASWQDTSTTNSVLSLEWTLPATNSADFFRISAEPSVSE